MPVISRTRIQQTGGSTMDALLLGELWSGRIILKITKDLLFSYSTTPGAETIEDGAAGGNCYKIRRIRHTLKWKAKIHTLTEKTVRSVVRRAVNGLASGAEQGGAVVTAAGGAAVLLGLRIAASPIPANKVGGAPLVAAGGIIGGVGSVLWGGGAFVRWLSEDETTVTEADKCDAGTRDFESVAVELVPCQQDKTYPFCCQVWSPLLRLRTMQLSPQSAALASSLVGEPWTTSDKAKRIFVAKSNIYASAPGL